MKKLVSLLAIFMLVVSMASARPGYPGHSRTILVTETEIVPTGEGLNLIGGVNAAIMEAVPGDTIVLAASDVDYKTSPSVTLNGITLKGQNRDVTLLATVMPWPVTLINGGTLENLHLKTSTAWGTGITCGGGAFKISKVMYDQCTAAYGAIVIQPSSPANPVTGTVEYVTTKGFNAPIGVIQLGTPWDYADAEFVGDSVGPITVNHCTLTYSPGYCVMITAGYPDRDGAKLEIKNSICGGVKTSGVQANGIFFASNHADRPMEDVVAINHHHNFYPKWWRLEAHDWGPGVEDNPETPEIDESRPNGFIDTGATIDDEEGSLYGNGTDPFNDILTLDLTLKPDTSPALWKGDDGLHMGADVTTVPVELSAFEIE